MIRMLVIGYVFAIRSERAICRDVQVNLAYRWFCGLSIEDKVPDHSAFSRARHERFRESDMFRRVFERVVEACIAAGLVGGKGFARMGPSHGKTSGSIKIGTFISAQLAKC
jgi:transposase